MPLSIKELLIIVIASIGGIITSWYIHYKRSKKERMVCMIGEDCQDVLDSKYSTIILGVDNELWGLLYFAGVGIFYTGAFYYPFLIEPPLNYLALFGTGGATLYSIYLICVQAFVLKKWCEKCLVLSFFSFVVFGAVVWQFLN